MEYKIQEESNVVERENLEINLDDSKIQPQDLYQKTQSVRQHSQLAGQYLASQQLTDTLSIANRHLIDKSFIDKLETQKQQLNQQQKRIDCIQCIVVLLSLMLIAVSLMLFNISGQVNNLNQVQTVSYNFTDKQIIDRQAKSEQKLEFILKNIDELQRLQSLYQKVQIDLNNLNNTDQQINERITDIKVSGSDLLQQFKQIQSKYQQSLDQKKYLQQLIEQNVLQSNQNSKQLSELRQRQNNHPEIKMVSAFQNDIFHIRSTYSELIPGVSLKLVLNARSLLVMTFQGLIDCPKDICNTSIFIDGVQYSFGNTSNKQLGTITIYQKSKINSQISTMAVLEGREPKYTIDVRTNSQQGSEIQIRNAVLYVQIFQNIQF